MPSPNPSILPPQMQGVMFVTGYRGLGKSYLASMADLPQNICFLDFENKGEGIDSDLGFGLYRALTQEAVGKQGQGLFDIAWSCFKSIQKDRFTTVILDNIRPLEMAMGAEAVADARKYADLYGLNADKIKKNAWGHQNAVVNCMIGDMCAIMHAAGVRLIIATSHVKDQWFSGQPIPGKYRYQGADRWQELSILTLILVPGDNPPIPAAIVQKEQLGLIEIERNPTQEQIEAMMRGEIGHTAKRRLPYRLPEATFQKLRWYLYHPADFAEPDAGESVVQSEVDAFDSTLSKEQLQFVTAAIDLESAKLRAEIGEGSVGMPKQAKAFVPPGVKQANPVEQQIREMAKEHSVEEIAEELGVARPVVMAALEGEK